MLDNFGLPGMYSGSCCREWVGESMQWGGKIQNFRKSRMYFSCHTLPEHSVGINEWQTKTYFFIKKQTIPTMLIIATIKQMVGEGLRDVFDWHKLLPKVQAVVLLGCGTGLLDEVGKSHWPGCTCSVKNSFHSFWRLSLCNVTYGGEVVVKRPQVCSRKSLVTPLFASASFWMSLGAGG